MNQNPLPVKENPTRSQRLWRRLLKARQTAPVSQWRAWVALADGNASPAQGMDKKGVTAVLKSASKLDQLPMQGCLLNQKLHPSVLKIEADLNKFVMLIKTYLVNLKGKHIQFNVINREALLDAKAHPENYQDLVIRVAGYSALWVELDSVIQDEIIARTEQDL